MTQEQLAMQFGLCTCDPIYTSRKLTAPDCPWHSKRVDEAMESWAIQFGKWLQGCGYQGMAENNDDLWESKYYPYDPKKTTEELYQLFLKLPH